MKLAQKTNEGCSSDWMRMSGSMLDPNTVYSCIKFSNSKFKEKKENIHPLQIQMTILQEKHAEVHLFSLYFIL